MLNPDTAKALVLGRVLVVDDTKLITKMIGDILTKAGYEVATALDGSEALKKLRTFNPELIIMDVMMPGMDGYEVARTVRKDPQYSRTPILLLTVKTEIHEKIAGFEAGADDYLSKPFDPKELELHVRALLSRAHSTREGETEVSQGKIISLFSLRGGSGSTLLAVNLGACLAQLFGQEIPLVDLAIETGGASIMLDLLPRLTLSHLAKEESSVFDLSLIREYLAPHSSGVRLLAAPATPVLAETVSPTLVKDTLTMLRANYSHILVDTPHTLGDMPLAALDISDLVLLLVPPDMVSLKAAAGALETFASLGYPDDRTQVILNWVFPRRALPQKEIEVALGRPVYATIPYEPDAVVRSINEGIPLVMTQPNLPWVRCIEALAFRIASVQAKARAEADGSRRVAAIKKRMMA